jgi:hypothetical protein
MKRMVLIATGLMLLAGSAFAQPFPGLPDTAYVGLFADVAHSVRSVNYGGAPAGFQWYIYWLPSKMGLQAAEFAISLPSNVIGMTILASDPAITVQMGTLAGGLTIAFHADSCQTNWVFSHKVQSVLMSAAQSQIMVVENINILPFPAYQVASCELGYPIEPVKRFTHLYLNWDGGTAVEPKSWGSIKSLFK